MMAEPEEEPPLELTEEFEEPEAFFEPPPPPPMRRPMPMDDGLISDQAADAASRAFAAGLAGFKRGGPSLTGDGPIGRSDNTLEQIVYDLVRPMIREWLDDNLPTMVERLVKREIERVVRRGLD
jgi:cell pole-organizing protein PopZ